MADGAHHSLDGKSDQRMPEEDNAVAGHEFREQLLAVLEEQHRAAMAWLERHHGVLRLAVEHTCAGIEQRQLQHQGAAVPEAEPEQVGRPLRRVTFEGLPSSGPSPAEEGEKRDGDELDAMNPEQATLSKSSIPRLTSREAGIWWTGIGNTSGGHFLKALLEGAASTEPPRGSCRDHVRRVLNNPKFDLVIGILIIINTVIMFTQLEIEAPSPTLDYMADDDSHKSFAVISHCFNAAFFLELLVRIYAKRGSFFMSAFNWVDAGIVLITSVDAYILSQLSGNRGNISFMRLARFIRVVRALRVIRTMNLFRQLRVLLNTIAMSFMSLFWSMLILFIFMLMFSLFLCQMLQGVVEDASKDQEIRDFVYRYYGTSFKALYTVFEITFSGGWPNYARPVVEEVNAYYALAFVIYITGVVFAMVRIISALFLKDTLQTAANDADMMIQERQKEMKLFVNKLSELFNEADKSKDGFLSLEELQNIMSYPKVKVWMGMLGLDVTETKSLFNMLDDGDGQISWDEFVSGIQRLKGTSRAQDTIAIMKDCQRISKHCEATQRACEELRECMGVVPSGAVHKALNSKTAHEKREAQSKRTTRSHDSPSSKTSIARGSSGTIEEL
mmetsp:Transcript_86319/g.252582  ORF Transcript_86319/g.252582 Transcript_86319/m.252582 type:complete len:615 (-) Transcript_86319:133-1977(-)